MNRISEELTVPASSIALIIGKAGKNIRDLEAVTGGVFVFYSDIYLFFCVSVSVLCVSVFVSVCVAACAQICVPDLNAKRACATSRLLSLESCALL